MSEDRKKQDIGELVVNLTANADGMFTTFDAIEKRIETLKAKFDELKAAMLSVANGDYHYSHGVTGKLATLFQTNHANNSSLDKAILHDVEIEFLKLASTDMTYKEIADIMKLTPRMIDNHRDSLFIKLNVKSRVGLAIYAIKNGIVTF